MTGPAIANSAPPDAGSARIHARARVHARAAPAKQRVKAGGGADTLPGRLHAISVEPLEMPALSNAHEPGRRTSRGQPETSSELGCERGARLLAVAGHDVAFSAGNRLRERPPQAAAPVMGASSAGLRTQQLPPASAGATVRAPTWSG
jgi:hypothetical protein